MARSGWRATGWRRMRAATSISWMRTARWIPASTATDFRRSQDYGNAMMKLSTAGGKLAVADYFEPYNTRCRVERRHRYGLGRSDAAAGHDGCVRHGAAPDWSARERTAIFMWADRDNLGKFNQRPRTTAICIRNLPNALANGAWSSPAYFNGTVYYAGRNDTLKAFPITQAKLATTPSSQSAVVFPYPGSTPSVSANGTQNGIVWAVESNPAAAQCAARLRCDEPEQRTLQQQPGGGRARQFGNGNKFITPVIVNGKVFVGTPTGVAEFGLLP